MLKLQFNNILLGIISIKEEMFIAKLEGTHIFYIRRNAYVYEVRDVDSFF